MLVYQRLFEIVTTIHKGPASPSKRRRWPSTSTTATAAWWYVDPYHEQGWSRWNMDGYGGFNKFELSLKNCLRVQFLSDYFGMIEELFSSEMETITTCWFIGGLPSKWWWNGRDSMEMKGNQLQMVIEWDMNQDIVEIIYLSTMMWHFNGI